ncbi:MAG: McrC family protein [Prevotellaceae bacterium]|jgi:5-methylcytosine-specific restriction endonuclease McrBC regulatory subunit McrC|nr:McrC family protein [Prevotellaceae bacterium]
MAVIQLTDNSSRKWSDPEIADDYPNLRLIANRSITELVQQAPNLLIFPHSLQAGKDKLGKESVLSLMPCSGGYQVSTGNIMGFIGINDTQLSITSRFARNHEAEGDYFLHYLLSRVSAVNLFDWEHEVSNHTIFDFLIYLFPRYLNDALSQGLYKEYQHREYNDANVRGTIDVSRHIRRNIPFSGRIAYRTREFSYDNVITQLIRHTIEYIRRHRLGHAVLSSNADTESFVQQIVEATPGYSLRDRQQIVNRNLRPKRHPYFWKYAELQRLCLQILRQEALKYGAAEDKVYGVLFDGAWLWEEYLALLLKEVGFQHPQNKERKGSIHLFTNSRRYPRYPDYYREDEVWDAKYKHLSTNETIDRNDMHQLIAYMHHFKALQGGFICPHKGTLQPTQEPIGTLKGHGGDVRLLKVGIPTCDDWSSFCQEMNQTESRIKGLF